VTDYERIEKTIRYLARHFRDQPSLATLAKEAGLSESHFHRLFTRWAGTTPKSFLKALTAAHAMELLRASRDVLSASFEAGLSGPGRLHDLLVSVEAVTPGELRSSGAGIEIAYGVHATPFGECLLGLTSRGVCHLAFLGEEGSARAVEELRAKWPNASLVERPRATAPVMRKIFAARGRRRLSVLMKGSAFQLKVWQALLRIPPGHVGSYGTLARAVGARGAARAVGSAVGSNSIAFLIPCHRVIRETGDFGQYRWTPERKQALLAWEYALREGGRRAAGGK
jgi:AraC family transcriptional regulator, regulatory protein of adaptative response / methylated-DNA-[protein]-cysteine methyltransferase